jgi:hypothetical protein
MNASVDETVARIRVPRNGAIHPALVTLRAGMSEYQRWNRDEQKRSWASLDEG